MTATRNAPIPGLEGSRKVRTARADLRRALRLGTITLAEALERPEAQKMFAVDLLELWLPAKGNQWVSRLDRAEAIMYRAQIGYIATVGQLTSRQRRALVYQTIRSVL